MPFHTTRWSLVLQSREPGAGGTKALGELLAAYWQPVYVLFRRFGSDRDAAADLTQGLFADLLARGDLAGVLPERGRFRAFLRTCARNWWTNERARATAQKRGGGAVPLSLDDAAAESWLAAQAVDELDAAALFERRWACSVLDRALWQLEQDELAAGRQAQFAALRGRLDGSEPGESWAVLATRLDTNEGALRVAAHRLRARFRDCVAAEVRETLADAHLAGDELQELLAALQPRRGRGHSRNRE